MKILSLFWHNVEIESMSSSTLNGSNPMLEKFKEHIHYILENYTPISIADFMAINDNNDRIRSFAKPPVLLGFDDGLKNVMTYALPVLKEYEIPALFFVIGEIINNPDYVPWYIEREYLFRATRKKRISFDNAAFHLDSVKECIDLRRRIDTSFKALGLENDRQRFMEDIAKLLDVQRPVADLLDEDLRFVNRDDLSKLESDSLLTVASHAMTHRCLASLSHEEQVYELEQSNRLLSRHCHSYYPVISYPDGSFNNDTVSIAKQIYRAAFAVLQGSSYGNLYAYPRIGLQQSSVKELAYATNPFRVNFLLPIKKYLQTIGMRR